jgi:hypothetical protein
MRTLNFDDDTRATLGRLADKKLDKSSPQARFDIGRLKALRHQAVVDESDAALLNKALAKQEVSQ